MLNRIVYSFGVTLCCLFTLAACDNKSPIEEPEIQVGHSVPEAKKLRDVVGPISPSQSAVDKQQSGTREITISNEARPFIGRYNTQIECSDKIVNCKEGKADIILNLLPDGTAHRTIIHLGKITYATNLQYSEYKWYFDPETKEVVVERSNGVNFFFNTDQPNKLVMNAQKVISGTEDNRKYFESGHPKPMRDYVLVKED